MKKITNKTNILSLIKNRRNFIVFSWSLLLIIASLSIILILPKKSESIEVSVLGEELEISEITLKNIYVYNINNELTITDEKKDYEYKSSYQCNSNECIISDINYELNLILLFDDTYTLFNYEDGSVTKVSLDKKYDDAGIYLNYGLYLKDNNKYAFYNINNNTLVSDFLYDGITFKDANNTFNGYNITSKYNQELYILDLNGTLVKHIGSCNSLKHNSNYGYCDKHVRGNLTNQDVDNVLDIVYSEYPNLSDNRLFIIKSAIETVGLPYLWGGGHISMADTLEVAESRWNERVCAVYSGGFNRQPPGGGYPCGLDCSGFVRWLYYMESGIDTFQEGINVIGGRNPHLKQVSEENALPGDLIMDRDHVVIYLYTDAEGKKQSVHASRGTLVVEISNYDRAKDFWRLNTWE